MKTKLPLIVATYCSLCAVGSAFTLDFLSIAPGTTLPPDLIVNVPGYGNVQLSAGAGSALVVGNTFGGQALNFNAGESVTVTFLGAALEPNDIAVSSVGVNLGEFFTAAPGINQNEFVITLAGQASSPPNSGAGVSAIAFEQVPEPSAALLGALGTALLVIRRKR